MEDSIIALSKYRYEKAVKNLNIAKKLIDDYSFEAALNRAYYSAFDGMRSVNALDKFDSSKHSGVIAYFNREYVKTGKFPTDTSSIIRRASMFREKSDYEDFYEAQKDDAVDTVTEVEIFLGYVNKYLISQNVL